MYRIIIILTCFLLFSCDEQSYLYKSEKQIFDNLRKIKDKDSDINLKQNIASFNLLANLVSYKSFNDPFSLDNQVKLNPNIKFKNKYLEKISIDKLIMVGYVKDNKKWGIVKGNDSSIYRVSVGDFIGNNYGKIEDISKDKIIVTEFIADDKHPDTWKTRNIQLNLRKSNYNCDYLSGNKLLCQN